MIDLHYVATGNGQKISIMLEELGLPSKRANLTPERWSNFFGERFLRASENPTE